jgi:hypothetical protein
MHKCGSGNRTWPSLGACLAFFVVTGLSLGALLAFLSAG